MAKHILRPSAAHRWMACPGSVALEKDIIQPPSRYAAEGTAAHEIAARSLQEGKPPETWLGVTLNVDGYEIDVDDEMVAAVERYRQNILDVSKDNLLMVERDLPIDHITGEPGATGRGDAVILTTNTIEVHDFKYGRGVPVSPTDNPQGIMYLLGAVREYSDLGDFEHAKFVVYQPRINDYPFEWYLPIAKLMQTAPKFGLGAKLALSTLKMDQDELAMHLRPSEDACRFCKAKATCPALASTVAELTGADYQNALQEMLPEIRPSQVSLYMAKVGLVEDWCKAVRAECERLLLAGEPVDGWKLVQGRRGARAWSDEKAAEELMRKKFRIPVEDMYSMKLASPTVIEKVLKDSPRRWNQLVPLISQSEGQPSVAPESDKRPALTVAQDEIQDLTASDLV